MEGVHDLDELAAKLYLNNPVLDQPTKDATVNILSRLGLRWKALRPIIKTVVDALPASKRSDVSEVAAAIKSMLPGVSALLVKLLRAPEKLR